MRYLKVLNLRKKGGYFLNTSDHKTQADKDKEIKSRYLKQFPKCLDCSSPARAGS